MANAKFIVKIGVIDPETNEEHWLDVYQEEGGRVVGLDSRFLADTGPDEPIKSPYGNKDIVIED